MGPANTLAESEDSPGLEAWADTGSANLKAGEGLVAELEIAAAVAVNTCPTWAQRFPFQWMQFRRSRRR